MGLTAGVQRLDGQVARGPESWLIFGAVLLATALGAGFYPALMLSRFDPATVLKGSHGSRASGSSLRRALVVFQFAVTVFLIVATAVVYQQLQFIRSSDVGFSRDQVVVVQLADGNDRRAVPSIQEALEAYPGVIQSAAMNAIPGNQRGGYGLSRESDSEGSEPPSIAATPVGQGVIETLGIQVISGSGFVEAVDPLARPDSGRYQYVVNQDLVRLAGWTPESAIGQRMSVSGGRRMGDVVGVIKNYNFLPLQEKMEPLALFLEPSWNVLLVKLQSGGTAQSIDNLKALWDESTGGSPFQYSFLDDDYDQFYRSEKRLAMLFAGASQIAVLMACLGLFGLASYTAEERTREIGIRKALGASVPGLVGMLNREFAVLVLVGFAVAAPLAWMASTNWLSSYAFRTDIGLGTFAAAGLTAFLVAGVTVSFQSIRAARQNPVTALRHDQ
jgi:putative ABC transport system permease protein